MGLENRELTAAEQAVLTRLRKIMAKLNGVTEERDKFGHVAIKVGKQSLALLGEDDGTPSLGIQTDVTTQDDGPTCIVLERPILLSPKAARNVVRRPAQTILTAQEAEFHVASSRFDMPKSRPRTKKVGP